VTESSEQAAQEATMHTTELTESRKGVHVQTEVGLPEGFNVPSAALAPPATDSGGPALGHASPNQAGDTNASPPERQ
jgi:hypothetical protein